MKNTEQTAQDALRRIGVVAVRVQYSDGITAWQSVTDNHIYMWNDEQGLIDAGVDARLPLARMRRFA